MQFNERDIQRLIWTCQWRKERIDPKKKGAEYFSNQMDDLIHKLENYQTEMECPDCCDTHSSCAVHA